MKTEKSDRGFIFVKHPEYPLTMGDGTRLLSESSAIGDYEDALDNPGSSALWVGQFHHLSREEIADLIRRMQHWLDHKHLPLE
jgi:hypothetical protein